jgi:alkylhydroperoxidase family enzyme
MAEPDLGERPQTCFDEKVDVKSGIAVAQVDRAALEYQPIAAPADGNAGKPEFGDVAGLARRRFGDERAALAWTEAVTLISKHRVPDDIYEEARRQFSEKELVDLTAAVIAINAWNRAAIAFRATPQLAQSKIAA